MQRRNTRKWKICSQFYNQLGVSPPQIPDPTYRSCSGVFAINCSTLFYKQKQSNVGTPGVVPPSICHPDLSYRSSVMLCPGRSLMSACSESAKLQLFQEGPVIGVSTLLLGVPIVFFEKYSIISFFLAHQINHRSVKINKNWCTL